MIFTKILDEGIWNQATGRLAIAFFDNLPFVAGLYQFHHFMGTGNQFIGTIALPEVRLVTIGAEVFNMYVR